MAFTLAMSGCLSGDGSGKSRLKTTIFSSSGLGRRSSFSSTLRRERTWPTLRSCAAPFFSVRNVVMKSSMCAIFICCAS